MTIRPVTSTLTRELTISLTGTVETLSPGKAESGEREVHVDDVAVEGLSFDTHIRPTDLSAAPRRIASTNLLEGVDTFDANIIRFLENILAAVRDDAEEALVKDPS